EGDAGERDGDDRQLDAQIRRSAVIPNRSPAPAGRGYRRPPALGRPPSPRLPMAAAIAMHGGGGPSMPAITAASVGRGVAAGRLDTVTETTSPRAPLSLPRRAPGRRHTVFPPRRSTPPSACRCA